MGRNFAGILGLIVYCTVILRGLIHGAGVVTTLQMACLGLLVFSCWGFVLGKLAELAVRESVRAKLIAEINSLTPVSSQ